MQDHRYCGSQHNEHAFASFGGTDREGLCLVGRRNMIKAGLAGIAGLSLPDLLRHRAHASEIGNSISSRRSVILLWMTGGPSHIDMWDMKPDRPLNNRGPFSPIATAIPGEFICEHLPKQAAMLDKFTIIRSVDCKSSNHEPNMVMQTGHRDAAPRVNSNGDRYPAIGSVVSKFRGANDPSVPPYVAFQTSRSHIGYAGYLGQQYNPFMANQAAKLPIYGGISKGLKPLLPLFDHLITTLVSDLDRTGLLDEVLVIAMGEFGRTPNMGTQGSTDGRDHWPNVMSMCLAGGGLRHGQIIGSTERDGGAIKSRPVTPGDLAATIYHHMQVPLHETYLDDNGRPQFIVQENGQPIRELI